MEKQRRYFICRKCKAVHSSFTVPPECCPGSCYIELFLPSKRENEETK